MLKIKPLEDKLSFDYNYRKEFMNYTGRANDEVKELKIRKLEKILDETLEENAVLKLNIKELEKVIKSIKTDFKNIENSKNSYKSVFFDREKDLLETVKLLEFENRKLEQKINDINQECKDKVHNLTMDNDKYRDIKYSTGINTKSIYNSTRNEFSKYLEDLNIENLKQEKIIDIFNNFFEKYNIRLMSKYTKVFDYENVKLLLIEFENKHLSYYNNNIRTIPNSPTNVKEDNKIQDYPNMNTQQYNSTKSRVDTFATINEINTPKSENVINNEENLTKLEKRIVELENNFSKMHNTSTSISKPKSSKTLVKKNTLTPTTKKIGLTLDSTKSKRK